MYVKRDFLFFLYIRKLKIKNQSCKWEFFPYLNKKKVSFDSTQKFIDESYFPFVYTLWMRGFHSQYFKYLKFFIIYLNNKFFHSAQNCFFTFNNQTLKFDPTKIKKKTISFFVTNHILSTKTINPQSINRHYVPKKRKLPSVKFSLNKKISNTISLKAQQHFVLFFCLFESSTKFNVRLQAQLKVNCPVPT